MTPTPTAAGDHRPAIGQALRAERKRQGRSQTDVANALNTAQKVVSRAELGLSTVDTQLRVAAELGLSLTDLMAEAS